MKIRGILFIIIVFCVGNMYISIDYVYAADDYNYEQDFSVFLDSIIDNITVRLLQPVTLTNIHGKVINNCTLFNVSSVIVRASTTDYIPSEFENSDLVLHNMGYTELHHLYTSKLINPNFKSVQEYNETSKATGFRCSEIDTLSMADITGDDVIITTGDDFEFTSPLLPQFRDLTYLLTEEDDGNVITNIHDTDEYFVLINGFANTQEAILRILRGNIAANITAMTNTFYSYEDIEIVSYSLIKSEETTYISTEYMERFQNVVNDVIQEEGSVIASHSLFGIKSVNKVTSRNKLTGFWDSIKEKTKKVLPIVQCAATVASGVIAGASGQNLGITDTILLNTAKNTPVESLAKQTVLSKTAASLGSTYSALVTVNTATDGNPPLYATKEYGTHVSTDVTELVIPPDTPFAELGVIPENSYLATEVMNPPPEESTTDKIKDYWWVGIIIIAVLLVSVSGFIFYYKNRNKTHT